MYGPHFYSMKIPQDVREFAAQKGIAEAEALARAAHNLRKIAVPPSRLIWDRAAPS